MILTSRDRHLLSELETIRVIDREQAKLFGPFGSTTRANARLLALTRAGYLQRVFVGTIAGGRKALYCLPGTNGGLLRQARKNPLAAERAVQHQLLLNHIYHALVYISPPNPQVEVGEWRRFTKALAPTAPLIPDGYVRLSTPAGDVGFFIEADLGTEPQSVWKQKTIRYLQFAMSGEYERSFGLQRFGVAVVVQAGRRRLEGIRNVIASHTDKLFWLAQAEEVGRAGAWAPVWLRPYGEKKVSLMSALPVAPRI